MRLLTFLRDPFVRRGARDMMVFGPAMGAWAIVTGVAMSQSGLGTSLSLLMSLLVFAGTAQLASLPLIAAGAPMWVVWASALCLNLRFAIFSSQWRVHLGHVPRGRRVALGYLLADLNLVAFQQAWPGGTYQTGQARYIAGGAISCWLLWQCGSIAGIVLSSAVPLAWGLGFAGTLSMLGKPTRCSPTAQAGSPRWSLPPPRSLRSRYRSSSTSWSPSRRPCRPAC